MLCDLTAVPCWGRCAERGRIFGILYRCLRTMRKSPLLWGPERYAYMEAFMECVRNWLQLEACALVALARPA